MNRQDANRKLLAELSDIVESEPNQRFSQILYNYGFVKHTYSMGENYWEEEFSLEPNVLLNRVIDTRKKVDGK